MITTKAMSCLINILGAVESGGQIYGNRDYAAYAGPYTNSNLEHTITLGWAQNYGYEAHKLIKMIHDADVDAFRKIDTAGIENMLNKDWVAIRWNPTHAQKQVLIKLIDSGIGHKMQDKLFAELMEKYVAECERKYTKDTKAILMYCEIRHLGGGGPVKRIFDRLDGNYSLDAIMASLVRDQYDTSSDNQVGDRKYWSRHLKCKQWIEQYITDEKKEESKVGVTATDILNIYRGWIGLSRSAGTHKVILDTYNNYIRNHPGAGRGYIVQQSDAYCDTTLSAAFIKANAVDLIGGVECGCEEHIKIFKAKGIWNEDGSVKPKSGWIILYNWDDGSQPNDGYSDHIGIVEKVSGNQITCIEGNTNGGMVARRTIPIGWGYIRGYAMPKYDAESKQDTKPTPQPQPSSKEVKASYGAESFDKTLAGTYATSTPLWCRDSAGTKYDGLCVIPEGHKVQCYGYYSTDSKTGRKWLYVQFNLDGVLYTGFASSYYMHKV